ncbi:MAG: DUF4440 domain-containing protein [Acidocella sp. 20-57-95]|nr:MAG: DUF4440 domain-containing protein [Acidocella sp. 20-57-95]OYV58415.1 MAG: DUF4440 domain-containing protein [Acidocella sp. 21-58-7]HQT62900.1 oxalurate catabolism protein HpxZ [Acidocella sp.]
MMINDDNVMAEVSAEFNAYEAALMANDIEALDRFFWRSPLAVRFGAGESLFGFEQIAAFRSARAGGSPARTLQATQVVCFGTDHAVTTTEFKRADDKRTGRQTQVWVRFEGDGWRIVSAHVSFSAEKS